MLEKPQSHVDLRAGRTNPPGDAGLRDETTIPALFALMEALPKGAKAFAFFGLGHVVVLSGRWNGRNGSHGWLTLAVLAANVDHTRRLLATAIPAVPTS